MFRMKSFGTYERFVYLVLRVFLVVVACKSEEKMTVAVLTKPGCNTHEIIETFRGFNVIPVSLDVYNTSFLGAIETLLGKFELHLDVVVSCGKSFLDRISRLLAQKWDVPFISLEERNYLTQDKYSITLVPPFGHLSTVVVGLAMELGCDDIVVMSYEHENDHVFRELKQKATKNGISFQVIEMHANRDISETINETITALQGEPHDTAVLGLIDNPSQAGPLIKLLRVMSQGSFTEITWLVMGSSSLQDQGLDAGLPQQVLRIHLKYSMEDWLHDTFTLLNETYHSGKSRYSVDQVGQENGTRGIVLRSMILQQAFHGKTGVVRFDELGQRIGTEYEIVAKKVTSQKQAQWKPVGKAVGLNVKLELDFWRQDATPLQSHSITMVTILDEPMTMVRKEDVKSDKECYLSHPCTKYVKSPGNSSSALRAVRCCCVGFMVDILHWIEKDFHLRVELYFIDGGPYGSYDPSTRQWNGIVKELVQGKADIALTALETNFIRSRYIEFSFPFLYAQTRIVVSASKAKIPRLTFSFLAPFDEMLWRIFLGSVALLTIVVWCLERKSPSGHYKSGIGNAKENFRPSACMSYIWSSVVKLPVDDAKPRSLSARLTTAVFSFATLIITTSYTANLAASLVNLEESLPIEGIRDPKLQRTPPTFRLATVESSSTEMYFMHNSNPAFKRIGDNMEPNNVETYTEGLEKLHRGELDGFIYESPFLDFGASRTRDCPFRLVGKRTMNNPLAIGFPKGSSWTQPMSLLFLKYQKKDYFRRLKERWFGTSCLTAPHSMDTATRMDVSHFGGLFLVCLSAAVVCVIFLVLHTWWHFRRSRGTKEQVLNSVVAFQANENASLAYLY